VVVDIVAEVVNLNILQKLHLKKIMIMKIDRLKIYKRNLIKKLKNVNELLERLNSKLMKMKRKH
jgi:hypothetical protein